MPAQFQHRRPRDGAYIGFDRFGMGIIQSDDVRVEGMHSLLQDGYAEHLLISHDCAFCQRGMVIPDGQLHANPMHYSRVIEPRLRALGIEQSVLDSLLTDNPRRYFDRQPPARRQG